RAKRLVSADEYAYLATNFPNLVATKNTTDSLNRLRDLFDKAPELRHFVGESGFAYGCQIGECGLLISAAGTNVESGNAYFAAGVALDLAKLLRMEGELRQVVRELVRVVGEGDHIDSAYDKVLWKLHDPEFPLRLLPPYRAAPPDAADK